ncbi:IS3 family transposase [Mycolicibacterium peregrinum]|uniref:IS3 family transposase n=1 Tax=Mycolicibacterium peregrinum TaxID=43304 RepID=UPI003AF3BD62
MIVDYIDTHKQVHGVEPICPALAAHGCKIAPSTYDEACGRRQNPSKRQVRDEELKAEIIRVHRQNYSAYGARKVWLQCRREGIEVARCSVERLVGELELCEARRGKPSVPRLPIGPTIRWSATSIRMLQICCG